MSLNLILGYGLLIVSAVMLIWFVKKIVSDAISNKNNGLR